MFFLGRKPAVFNKKSAFYKKSKKNEKAVYVMPPLVTVVWL